MMAVITATSSFVGTELVLATALASSFLLMLVAVGSFISCCRKYRKKTDDNDNFVVVSPPPVSVIPTASNRSLSSTIQSKDFFRTIEVPSFTPACRRGSLSNLSIPATKINTNYASQVNDNDSVYQNLPSRHYSSALPTRPQTALPVTRSVFVFPDTTPAIKPCVDLPEYINLAKDVPAVSEVWNQRAAYINTVQGKRNNRQSRIGSESNESRKVVTYVRPQRRHSVAFTT